MSESIVNPGIALAPAMTARRRGTLSVAPAALALSDAVAIQVALLLGFLSRMTLAGWFPIEVSWGQYAGLAAGVLTLLPGLAVRGLYPGYGLTDAERLKERSCTLTVMMAALLAWDYLVQGRQWSRGILLFTYLYALLLLPWMEMWVRTWLMRKSWFGTPVAILGAGRTGRLLARLFAANESLGFKPCLFFDDDRAKWGRTFHGVPVQGPVCQINRFRDLVGTVVIAMPGLSRQQTAALVESLSYARVIVVPDMSGLQSLWVDSRDLGGVLGLQLKRNLLAAPNLAVKRIIDLAVAIPLGLLCAPLIAVLAALVKWADPGPAFFYQEREGYGGRRIRVWKLRTMRVDAERILLSYLREHPSEREQWERCFKLKNDPRVIPVVGRFLRRFSLDELPQLWNVVKGEMSLVGPRPFPDYHLERFAPEFRSLRRSVMPGLSGLWQITARSDGDLDVQQAQDTYYIRNWSLWLDFHVLLRTAHVVLSGKGAY